MKWCRKCGDCLADDHRGMFCGPCARYNRQVTFTISRTKLRHCRQCGLIMPLDTPGSLCDPCFTHEQSSRARRFVHNAYGDGVVR